MTKSVIISFFSLVLLLIVVGCSNEKKEKDYYEKCRQIVLSENKTGIEYFFSRGGGDVDEIQIEFLGFVKINNQEFKIINSINFSGLYQDSKRATASVNFYNDNNQYIGSYYVGGVKDVPTGIENNKLIFDYKNNRCNRKTEISFEKEIPNEIFIECTEKGGDLYSFSKE